jgi:ABC-type Na+ efflux pump permease subunit
MPSEPVSVIHSIITRAKREIAPVFTAARPWDIVLGKVAGVGGVSLLVVTAWLGSSMALSGLSPGSRGMVAAVLHGLAQPADLLRAGAIYLLAFAFYGFVTVAIGARARDNADAQNLARPMFAVLLAVFFAALFSTGGARGLDWLLYAPPFTPFMLLLTPHGLQTELAALSGLGVGTAVAALLAVEALRVDFRAPSLRDFSLVRPKS